MKAVIALIIQIQFFSLGTPASFGSNSNDLAVEAKQIISAPSPTCLLPSITPDKTYTVNSPNKDEFSNSKPEDLVPQFTVIVTQCNEGYAFDDQPDGSNEYLSVCMRGLWKPPVPTCKKSLKWVKYSDGEKCSNAVVGGYMLPSNETVFIARHKFQVCNEPHSRLITGNLVPSQKLASLAIFFQSYYYPEYEVLCGDAPTKWVATSKGVVPKGAILGGYSHTGAAAHICRQKIPDGSLVVGVTFTPETYCILPYKGGEITKEEYEILVE